ncbi:MAG TPA: FGLLP motif-containing membrane protein [Candidatus Saccharimonadales bacterium]|nr:FGLLP motif-containing membrane protein [Candidatus Saccharimonadales bacterium]
MKNLFKFIFSLSAAILLAVFLYGKTTQPAKVYANHLPDITSSDTTVTEGVDNNAVFVLKNNTADNNIDVSYNTQDGTAVSDQDYTATSSANTVNLPPGGTTTIQVPILIDSSPVQNETFTLNVSYFSPSADTNVSDSWTGTITHNPPISPSPTPLPAVTINDVTINENAGVATFTFTFNYPNTDSTNSFAYRTIDGTAVNPDDYTATGGTVVFGPGDTTQTVNVPIVDDSVIEPTENFTMNVYTFNNNFDVANFPPQLIATGTGTIIDNDSPSNPGGPGDGKSDGGASCPSCTQPHNPPTQPNPTPPTFSFLPPSVLGDSTTPTPTPTPAPTIFPTILPPGQNGKPESGGSNGPVRSLFAASVLGPKDIPITPRNLLISALITIGLVLLIVFPSELFNSTVQSNYDEIAKWSLVHRIKKFYDSVNHMPALIVVIIFAILGAIINSFLSPDFGFNKATYSLVLGMLLALAAISLIYDVTRSYYMKRRFGYHSKLRAHSLGLVTGAILVAMSRFANFVPGYCFGIFTALVFRENPDDRQNGEGLAFASALLMIVGVIGWIVWIPIKEAATAGNPSLWILVFDAAFASLWVSMLTGTVFGLLPMRFMYGETIKNWNSKVWAAIYFTGLFLFVYTILNPVIGIYGKSDKVNWFTVLFLFFAFGAFSFGFWGYFRYRANFGWKASKK